MLHFGGICYISGVGFPGQNSARTYSGDAGRLLCPDTKYFHKIIPLVMSGAQFCGVGGVAIAAYANGQYVLITVACYLPTPRKYK